MRAEVRERQVRLTLGEYVYGWGGGSEGAGREGLKGREEEAWKGGEGRHSSFAYCRAHSLTAELPPHRTFPPSQHLPIHLPPPPAVTDRFV